MGAAVAGSVHAASGDIDPHAAAYGDCHPHLIVAQNHLSTALRFAAVDNSAALDKSNVRHRSPGMEGFH
jgi:hypothetical protein